jgi:hypothetical protein
MKLSEKQKNSLLIIIGLFSTIYGCYLLSYIK